MGAKAGSAACGGRAVSRCGRRLGGRGGRGGSRFDVRCARSAMDCGRRRKGSRCVACDGWATARRRASRMRKTEVEGGVFHVKHLYADKPHLRSARMHGPSALAGKLRVPSGDPRPELEVSGGGVQTGVQTEVRAACAGCGRALPQSPSGGGQFLASRSRQRVVRSVRRFARDSEPHTARNATSAMARPAQRLRAWSVRTKGGGGAALGRPRNGRGVAASVHFRAANAFGVSRSTGILRCPRLPALFFCC